MPAGEATWVETEIRNIGRDDLLYSGGCGATNVFGEVAGATWRPGANWLGEAAAFKEWALARLDLEANVVWIGFTPEWAVAEGVEFGEYGCADMLIAERLAPGARLVERARWNGQAAKIGAPPPAGQVDLSARLSFYWREAEDRGGPPRGASARVLEAALPTWVHGGAEPPLVHPAEAIDIALADPEFGEWILGHELRRFFSWYVRYVPDEASWHITLWRESDGPPSHYGAIDAHTGELVEIGDRP